MDTDVLVSFKKLCSQYPNENVDVLWEMAGGDAELAQLLRIKSAAREVANDWKSVDYGLSVVSVRVMDKLITALDTKEG